MKGSGEGDKVILKGYCGMLDSMHIDWRIDGWIVVENLGLSKTILERSGYRELYTFRYDPQPLIF